MSAGAGCESERGGDACCLGAALATVYDRGGCVAGATVDIYSYASKYSGTVRQRADGTLCVSSGEWCFNLAENDDGSFGASGVVPGTTRVMIGSVAVVRPEVATAGSATVTSAAAAADDDDEELAAAAMAVMTLAAGSSGAAGTTDGGQDDAPDSAESTERFHADWAEIARAFPGIQSVRQFLPADYVSGSHSLPVADVDARNKLLAEVAVIAAADTAASVASYPAFGSAAMRRITRLRAATMALELMDAWDTVAQRVHASWRASPSQHHERLRYEVALYSRVAVKHADAMIRLDVHATRVLFDSEHVVGVRARALVYIKAANFATLHVHTDELVHNALVVDATSVDELALVLLEAASEQSRGKW